MINFPNGCSFLTPDFSFCSAPIPSKPISLVSTVSIVLDKNGHPHFTQELRSRRLGSESTFVPLHTGEAIPRAPVIIAELPNSNS